MKTKEKSDADEVTDFYNKEIPKVDSNHTCLAVISLYSALCCSQVFLKECIYIEKKVVRHIISDLESFSDDSDNSDEE